MFCNARFINNKTTALREYLVDQKLDLACVTEIWVREENPQGFQSFTSHGLMGWGGTAYLGVFSYRALPAPKISLVLEAEVSLGIWLVYRPPNAPADTLPSLLEVISDWALDHPQ